MDVKPKICWLCGRRENGDHLDIHHIFGGSFRKKSDRLGLVVYLHHNSCHIYGKNAVHANRETDLRLKRYGEHLLLDAGWTREQFINEFGKDYDFVERKGV